MPMRFAPPARYDAVIIGGRVAGAATAMLLARQGLKVCVIERRHYGSDTLSTHALMRGAVLQLTRWGLVDRLEAAGTPAVRSTSFHYEDERLDIEIKHGDGVGALYAPRRTVLDALLVDAAIAAGAEFRFNHVFVSLVEDVAGRVHGAVVRDEAGSTETLFADIVIGADGLRSAVARAVRAVPTHEGRHASAVLYAYWKGVRASGYEWSYRPGFGTGTIPTNDGEICVFVAVPSDRLKVLTAEGPAVAYRALLAKASPDLADRLAGAVTSDRVRGFGGQPGFLRRAAGEGWALVGDAGYFKDPLTAHGITDALRDAEFLANAVVQGTGRALRRYEEERNEISLPLFRATDAIASFAWTIESLKSLHLTLNAAMKEELAEMKRAFGMELSSRRAMSDAARDTIQQVKIQREIGCPGSSSEHEVDHTTRKRGEMVRA